LKNIFLIIALFFAVSFAGDGPVSYYGKLKVRAGMPFIDGVKEGREDIKLVQIRGVSFGWSNTGWESSRFYNAAAVERVAKDWKAEIVRAAYGATGLAFTAADALANRERIETIVDAAIENDIYVIIDWHSHSAQNEVQNSKDFFEYMSNKYGSYPNVIFELYNEPINAEWSVIKSYAEQIIPVIRAHSSNLILVGTPNYSQKVQDVIGNAISDENLGYVLHFYAYSHSVSGWLDNMNSAISSRLPLFVTEYGTTHSDGGCSLLINTKCSDNPAYNQDHYNTHDAAKSDEWHNYMDSKKISSVAWNINDKYEGAAFFGTVPGGVFDQSEANWSDLSKMTASGKYIFQKLNKYYETAPWNPNSTPVLPSANLPTFDQTNAQVYSLSGKKMGNLTDANLKSGVYIIISKQNGVIQKKILKIVK